MALEDGRLAPFDCAYSIESIGSAHRKFKRRFCPRSTLARCPRVVNRVSWC